MDIFEESLNWSYTLDLLYRAKELALLEGDKESYERLQNEISFLESLGK